MSLQLRVNRRESSIQLDLSQKMETDIDVAPAFFRVSFVFMKSCVTTELGKLVQRLSSSFMSSIYAFTSIFQ